jgi:hypothetical protein
MSNDLDTSSVAIFDEMVDAYVQLNDGLYLAKVMPLSTPTHNTTVNCVGERIRSAVVRVVLQIR